MRLNQAKSIGLCRKSGFFQFVQLPLKTRKLYDVKTGDDEIKLRDEIEVSNKVSFIYSYGVNDFLEIVGTGLGRMLWPVHIDKTLLKTDEILETIIKRIEQNIDNILKLNNNIEVYILGLFLPTRMSYVRKRVDSSIGKFNNMLKKMCESNSKLIYIDNYNLNKYDMARVDWHPNFRGQQKIAENIIREMKKVKKLEIS